MIDWDSKVPPDTIDMPVDCEHAVRALWDYLDRTLDAPTMAAIDAHLAQCVYCREHERFERSLIDRLRALRREHEDVIALRGRVLETLVSAGWSRR